MNIFNSVLKTFMNEYISFCMKKYLRDAYIFYCMKCFCFIDCDIDVFAHPYPENNGRNTGGKFYQLNVEIFHSV